MYKLRDIETKQFPLSNISDVVQIVEDVLKSSEEPNIAFMSILLGIVEHSMTVFKFNENKTKGKILKNLNSNSFENCKMNLDMKDNTHDAIPTLNLETVELFYEKFYSLMCSNVDMKFYHLVDNFSPSGLVKRISDVVWDALTRTFYKDKNHLSSLYTMFTEKKMDCYGMAIGVLAGSQLLGLTDVNLVLTEDHAWAIFGPNKKINMEITWHGKGTEDKRGLSVETTAPENSWVYASPMVCDRWMEFASIVVSMNPVIHSSLESSEIASLQKQILWLLYDAGHLKRYPMALDCLADLEEIIPTPNRPKSIDLYNEALEVAKRHYNDQLIYPHTYLANYYYRRRAYKMALFNWANAAEVAGRYNYNREDDEMHREFYDVANEIIPNITRISGGVKTPTDYPKSNPTTDSTATSNDLKISNAKSFLEDRRCFIDVLRFFDGMCRWEEGSSMPVLHIIWANSMTFALTKFPAAVRAGVTLVDSETEELKCGSSRSVAEQTDSNEIDRRDSSCGESPRLILRSEKMAAIKDLFVAERVNTSAIKLQMTAQSQVAAKIKMAAVPDNRAGDEGGRKRANEEGKNAVAAKTGAEFEKGLFKKKKVSL